MKKMNFGYICSENKLQKEALFYFLILGISKDKRDIADWHLTFLECLIEAAARRAMSNAGPKS